MSIDFAPIAGAAWPLADDLTLVLAPNPSPMTHLGTNTYILGTETLAIIDPGPDDPAHLDALLSIIADRPVTHILLTHSHLDHSPLAGHLAARTGAPVCAFGDSMTGRSAVMIALANQGLAGGGEGVDRDFRPSQKLTDGAVVSAGWGTLTAIHTPGHMGNHLCFAWGDAIFTGDHVMGWASSLVSPPDGDLTDFMRSCARSQTCDARVFYPGHGAPIHRPDERLEWLMAHRSMRESQILEALSKQPADPRTLTAMIYHDVALHLRGAAERNVFAHLVDLHQQGKVFAAPYLSGTAIFSCRAE